jgi:hypothetical protein
MEEADRAEACLRITAMLHASRPAPQSATGELPGNGLVRPVAFTRVRGAVPREERGA